MLDCLENGILLRVAEFLCFFDQATLWRAVNVLGVRDQSRYELEAFFRCH